MESVKVLTYRKYKVDPLSGIKIDVVESSRSNTLEPSVSDSEDTRRDITSKRELLTKRKMQSDRNLLEFLNLQHIESEPQEFQNKKIFHKLEIKEEMPKDIEDNNENYITRLFQQSMFKMMKPEAQTTTKKKMIKHKSVLDLQMVSSKMSFSAIKASLKMEKNIKQKKFPSHRKFEHMPQTPEKNDDGHLIAINPNDYKLKDQKLRK